jgi:glyoxylase I family protein
MFHAIQHVSLVVTDLRQSLSFYRDTLGMQQCERPPLSFPGAWLQIGGQQIHLLNVPPMTRTAPIDRRCGRDEHLAILVDDLPQLIKRLESADIEVEKSGSGRTAIFCRDPDGNALEFIEA